MRGCCTFLLFFALGAFVDARMDARRAREHNAFAAFDDERFVTIVAPLERDWSLRRDAHLLRASRFTANDVAFAEPLTIYARFTPPLIDMQARVRAEGFLRRNERGQYTLTLKSPRLMSYDGELRGAAAWNRALALRLRPHARQHPHEAALVEALVLGRGERLTDEVRESFRRGGTYHLLVFSGLQIAFAAALLAMLLRWLHAPRASDWLLLAFAILAPLFIGPTASVSRASTGIGLYALSRILKRPTSLENLWCVAALLRLIIEPRDLIDVSFHLTYAGAGALLFLAKSRHWLLRAPAVELAITPLTLFHFHQFALGGSLVTLAMAPVIGVMLVVSSLACAVPCAWLFDALRVLHRVCVAMNGVAFSGFFTAPPLVAMIAGFGIALLSLRRAWVLSLALLVPTVAAVAQYATLRRPAHPQAIFLDIGQGDAIALRSGARTMLVDGGQARILPLLLERGMRRIDVALLTHAHPDHCGGLVDVVTHLPVGELWLSPRRFRGDCAHGLLEAARASRTPIRLVRDGDVRQLGELAMTIHIAERPFRRAADNNASVVLHVRAGKRSLLLTGDIERDAESSLSDRNLKADVLKVAHHGSRTSSTGAFLDAVAPKVAVISCGRRNFFGHPHERVVEALRERRIRTWRTDTNGTITIELRDATVRAVTQIDTPSGEP